MNQPVNDRRICTHSEIEKLQEEIAKLSNTLGLFGQPSGQVPPPEEMIETLTGIGQGSLSCAALLKVLLNESRSVGQQYKKAACLLDGSSTKIMDHELDVILEDARLIVKECSKLSAALLRIKRNIMKAQQNSLGNTEELDQVSQQVQAALMSLTQEWEDL